LPDIHFDAYACINIHVYFSSFAKPNINKLGCRNRHWWWWWCKYRHKNMSLK